jgi:hypothetical protein
MQTSINQKDMCAGNLPIKAIQGYASFWGILSTPPDPKVFGRFQGAPSRSKVFQTLPSLFPGKKRLFIFYRLGRSSLVLRRESTQINPAQLKNKPNTGRYRPKNGIMPSLFSE